MTTIRAARPADLETIAELERRIFADLAWSRETVTSELTAAGRTVVLAQTGDRAVGYAVLMMVGDSADLNRIAVAPGHRRNGIGSALLTHVIELCRSEGCASLLLEVAAGNATALNWYRRRGFVDISRRPRYYADGSDAVVMSLAFEPMGDGSPRD